MSNENLSTKDLGNASELLSEELVRNIVDEMFSNDNDTTFLTCTMDNRDGTQSTLEFMIRLRSIDGVKARDTEDED